MYKAIVIEDEKIIQDFVVSFVNECDEGFFVCESFYDGGPAIEYLKTNNVDLIITDVRMEVVSGLQVAEYVYKNNLPSKVIILSAYHDFEYAKQAIDYNVQAYLTKPTDPVEFKMALRKIKNKLDEENKLIYIDDYSKKETQEERDQVAKVIKITTDYINKNYMENISVSDVASKVYLSADYFGKIFKEKMGQSFTSYLISVRIENAIKLIKTSKYSVTEIGRMVGYSDSNYFIKVFRKHTGHTPKKYLLYSEGENEN